MNSLFKNKISISPRMANVCSKLVLGFYTLGIAVVGTNMYQKTVLAADTERPLTDLFKTEAFRGSWKVFEKWNWLGQILNFIIASVCFVSMFCIALSFILTIAYFCLRPFWDTVHEIKMENAGGGNNWTDIMGLKGYAKGALFSSRTSGLDTIGNLFYIFIPDIYAKSEMNAEHRDSSLTDDDTVITWLIKTGWKKVIMIFLLSMGFNGTLLQCFGMVADGLGVVGQHVADYKMDELVENILTSGENYKFSLGDTGTNPDQVKLNIAKECYKLTLGTIGSENQTTAIRQNCGKNIEARVKSEFNKEKMTQLLIANGQPNSLKLSDDDWKYIKFTVVENTDSATGKGSVTIPVKDVVGIEGTFKEGNRYLHVTPRLVRKAPSHNYIQVK